MNALLKKARLEKGYTTRALSAVTHIDNALLCKYENGKRNPTKEQLKILASTLDLNYNELLLLWTKNKIIDCLLNIDLDIKLSVRYQTIVLVKILVFHLSKMLLHI